MALLDAQIDGKYEILEKLREGGMGAIYKVRHRLLDEVRVVKVIRSQAEEVGEAADRFLSEARAAIKLRHPNVAVLHDFAVGGDGRAFIVMEHIDGWNLLEVLQGYGPPPLALTIEIARQSLKALGYLHRHKIVHRDVSPDNLMLTRDVDGNPLVKLIDLGIAKTLEGQGGLTTTGVFLGKPRYGSPERFGGGAWDERSDLYSFGVVLYELLTGKPPVLGADPTALMAGHLFRPPLDFAETDPAGRVPEELRRLVMRALAKKPEERIASAEDFVWELTLLQDRHPLTRADAEEIWRVLLPLRAGDAPAAERPGSTQDRLDLQFGMVTTPPTGLFTGESTLRVAPEATQPSVPPPAPTERIAPEGLDATWAARPLRTARPAPAPAPVAAPPAERPGRRTGTWIAAAGVALALGAGGAWWAWSPRGGDVPRAPVQPHSEVRPASNPSPTVEVTPVASATVVEAEPSPTPAPPSRSVPEKTLPSTARSSQVAALAPAAPLEPMKAGDVILHGQPGVEEPEVKLFPLYTYPAAAQGSGRKVSIRIAVLVDENGLVIDSKVREGDKSGLGFEEAALEAAKKARFFPATRDGVAGKMWTELIFDFSE